MAKKLVVSYDSYSWVKNCIGFILQNPKYFEVVIVSKDTSKQIYDCSRKLCEDAIYAQRKYDLEKIGTDVGIRKMYNLLHDEQDPDILKLVVQLQFNILVGGVSEVFYQKNEYLDTIFKEIKKQSKVSIYNFSDVSNISNISKVDKIHRLDKEQERKKKKLINLITGDSNFIVKNPEVCFRVG
jgi:hypothetical protein